MNIAGINLDNKTRNNFPQIKNKGGVSFLSKNNNNGSIIFDSHF